MSIFRRTPVKWRQLIYLCVLAGAVLAIGIVVTAQDGEFTPISDHTEVIEAWEGSAMGNTYDEGKGPNTYCSRCHSPQNWDPAAQPGPPPNCVTCKFPTDEEIRIAPTMDFVAEEDWVGISCDTCHQVEGDTINVSMNAWYNPISEAHVPVATSNELCTMCHVNSTGVSATGGRGVDHEVYLGGSAHINWAATTGERRPQYCVDCHDPHTQQPKTCVDCHEEAAAEHSDTHAELVTCIACHDASMAEVGPHPAEEMGGIWTTIESAMSRSGEPTVTAIVSHSVQWQVSCDRCHFEENAWGLSVLTAEGEPVEEETED